MSNVSYSPKAKQDLQEIKKYFEHELKSPSLAKRILQAITQRIRTLESYPKSGRKLSALINMETDYRFIGCKGYLAFYRVFDNNVYIVRIIHSKRDYVTMLFGDTKLDI